MAVRATLEYVHAWTSTGAAYSVCASFSAAIRIGILDRQIPIAAKDIGSHLRGIGIVRRRVLHALLVAEAVNDQRRGEGLCPRQKDRRRSCGTKKLLHDSITP